MRDPPRIHQSIESKRAEACFCKLLCRLYLYEAEVLFSRAPFENLTDAVVHLKSQDCILKNHLKSQDSILNHYVHAYKSFRNG